MLRMWYITHGRKSTIKPYRFKITPFIRHYEHYPSMISFVLYVHNFFWSQKDSRICRICSIAISMKKYPSIPLVLLSGVCLAQLGFMLLMYVSNQQLLAALKDIHGMGSGYIVIPGGKAMTSLGSLSVAFNGGLFFTFTLGAGLSVISFVCAWLWHYIFSRNKTILCIVSLFWLGFVITLNFNGPLFLISGILLLLPFAVFLFTLRVLPLRSSHSSSSLASFHCLYLHLTMLLILAIAGNFLAGGSTFTHVRDTFLLSNPAGMVINDFYYKYTLHAARVFKSLDQRVVNTCVIDAGDDEILYNKLEKVLVRADFFPLSYGTRGDLTVKTDNGMLSLSYCGHGILQCSVDDFLAKPLVWLQRFSLNTDRHGLFRKMIYVSLLVGLPIFIYTLCCSLTLMLLGRMGISEKKGNIAAPILVMLGGIVLLGILAYYSTVSGSIRQNFVQSLSSPHVRVRLAGLKNIGKQKLNIVDFQGYEGLLKSPHVAERYWAVRALASARGRDVQQRLLSLLNDPHPNVVCQALYALGKRRDKRVIPEIIHLITTSDHWYVQWYGYRALKKLGWKQIALK